MTLYLPPKGLFPSPNPRTETPKGALKTAKNVDIPAGGVCVPRRGYEDAISGHTTPGGYKVVKFLPYGAELYAISTNGSAWTMRKVSNSATEITDAASASLEFIQHEIRSEEAMEFMYFTAEDGIRKISSSADTVANKAGIRRALHGLLRQNVSADTLPFVSGDAVAYVILYYRKEVTNQKIFGYPSAPAAIRFTAAAAATITGVLPPDLVATDVAQIYRTKTAVSIAEIDTARLYLAGEHELTSTNITNGFFQHVDMVAEDALGAELYTNPEQETIDQANQIPPVAKDLAMYAGCMLYANTKRHPQILIELKRAGDSLLSIDRMTSSGTFGGGTDTITGVASVTNFRVGQYVTADPNNGPGSSVPAGDIPQLTQITQISGAGPYTLTLSNNTTGVSAANTFYVCDWISIGDEIYFAWDDSDSDKKLFEVEDSNEYHTMLELAYVVNEYGALHGGNYMVHPIAGQDQLDPTPNNTGQLLIEERVPSGSSFQVKSSLPSAWSPELEASTDNNTAEIEITPARLHWSKDRQPEAVPNLNYKDIGDLGSDILRIIATRDSLYIFKEDGIFRLYGFSPGTFEVTAVDRSLRLIHPEAAVRVGDWIYAWTDNGIIRISDHGTQMISNTPLRRSLQEIQSLIRQTSSMQGIFAAGHENDGQVFFGVPGSLLATASTNIYVFHVDTLAWTTHEIAAKAMINHPAADRMYVSLDTGYVIQKQRKTFGSTLIHADLDYAPTINDVDGNTITIDGGSGWTPAVGDLIVQSGNRAIVTAITSATVFDVDDATSFAAAAATAYVAFQSEIEFVAISETGPAMALHACATWDFESLRGIARMTASFTSTNSLTPLTTAIERTRVETDVSEQVEVAIGRAHSLAYVILPKLVIKQAAASWVLLGLELETKPVSIQVERGH